MSELSEPQKQVVSLRIASEYLSPSEACLPMLLNRYFAQHYANQAFKESVARRLLHCLPPEIQIQTEAGIAFRELVYISKGFKNLIKNPSGQEGFSHWARIDRGNGWTIEDWPEFRGRKSAFCSSYGWCSLSQSIDLPAAGYTAEVLASAVVVVGAVICARIDCGAVGKVTVQVGAERWTTGEVRCPEEGQVGWAFRPHTISVARVLPRSANTLTFTAQGKDVKFWAGQYGARFLHTFVHVLPVPPGMSPEQLIRLHG